MHRSITALGMSIVGYVECSLCRILSGARGPSDLPSSRRYHDSRDLIKALRNVLRDAHEPTKTGSVNGVSAPRPRDGGRHRRGRPDEVFICSAGWAGLLVRTGDGLTSEIVQQSSIGTWVLNRFDGSCSLRRRGSAPLLLHHPWGWTASLGVTGAARPRSFALTSAAVPRVLSLTWCGNEFLDLLPSMK